MRPLQAWFRAARSRIEARLPKPEIMDTQEKADAEGVPIGTSVLRYSAPVFLADPQQNIDDHRAAEILRKNPDLWFVDRDDV
jgi:hypothetical protein